MKNFFYSLCLPALLFLWLGCKKEAVTQIKPEKIVASSNHSEAKSDGVITVQTGILPPVTPQSFIANGGSSVAEFQVTSTKHIVIYQLFFSATFPFIQSVSINNSGSEPNVSGTVTFNGSGPFIDAGSGVSLKANICYVLVDSMTSGQTVQLKLEHIVYRTDDEAYHDFYPGNAGAAKTMCLVNNIPNITFFDPGPDTLYNGYRQIATLKLKGDTGWSVSDLPLHLTSLYSGFIPRSKLVIKYNKEVIAKSDSVELDAGSTAETDIHFPGGFTHTAGETELLHVFADVSGFYPVIITTMSPLSSLSWNDGLGKQLRGTKNLKFYKVPPGQSNFQ
ncbi:MAG: hypothetical protein JST21_14290 [Bacteroidetes bacterium]|nr:hypothetical protein [Bacteroidota bacterium]